MTDTFQYDYIIVGAGSAGCVLANRLSRDASVRVCLIEAGPPDTSPFIRMPGGLMFLMDNRRLNWRFSTDPEPHLNGRRLYCPRGKVLGGSSAINGMIYIRGHRGDYDGWAVEAGEDWSYDAVLPIFRELENNQRGGDAYHGSEGELYVSDVRDIDHLQLLFVASGEAAGLPPNPDFNGAEQDGVGLYQTTTHEGRRCSAAEAFLRPVQARPNLTVMTDSKVRRVLFDGLRATGVEVGDRRGRRQEIFCQREVVLSAGVIQSPQLLMLSGIGPSAELGRHGLAPLVDLPGVGQNLQDHIDILVSHKSAHPQALGWTPRAALRFLSGLWQYWRSGRGLLATNMTYAGGFARSRPGLDRPDLQLHFFSGIMQDHGRKIMFGKGFSAHVCNLRPNSRGQVTLRSADPLDDPLIQFNYLGDSQDMQAMIAGLRLARRILGSPPLARWSRGEFLPGPQHQSDEELADAIRQQAETIYHPVGTCRMGRDEMSVVDPQLRVRGVSGLRVADASIMPTLISGNTNATAMLIGEKCARYMQAAAESGAPSGGATVERRV